jgi:hypothetical protein
MVGLLLDIQFEGRNSLLYRVASINRTTSRWRVRTEVRKLLRTEVRTTNLFYDGNRSHMILDNLWQLLERGLNDI